MALNNGLDMSLWGSPVNLDVGSGFSNGFLPSNGIGYADWMSQAAGAGGAAPNGILGSLRSSGFLGTDGNQGWGGMALGAIGGLSNAFMSMRNYGLAKDALASSQNQFMKNYEAQKSTINAQLEDRQRARVAANPNSESVDSYLARNRIN